MKQPNVPVFLIYAGIIHAIGLALLLPIVVTLPGPVSAIAPESSAIDIEIVPATSPAAITGKEDEQTAALPSPEALPGEEAPAERVEAQPGADDPPDAEAGVDQGEGAIGPKAEPEDTIAVRENAKSDAAKPAQPARGPAKKSAVSRKTKPAVRRSTKTQAKIAPFNGALSGLFSPGAPAKRR
jgi:hypothetical protein